MSSNRDVEGEGFVTEPSGCNRVPEGEGLAEVAPRKSTAEALDELAEAVRVAFAPVVEALDRIGEALQGSDERMRGALRKGVLCGSRSAPSPVAGYLCGLTRGHESGKHQCRISGRVYVWDEGGTAVMLCGDRYAGVSCDMRAHHAGEHRSVTGRGTDFWAQRS